jgi:hypothetical protein
MSTQEAAHALTARGSLISILVQYRNRLSLALGDFFQTIPDILSGEQVLRCWRSVTTKQALVI